MKFVFAIIMLGLLVAGCNNDAPREEDLAETTARGHIRVSIDESFQPVMQEQLKVFQSSFPKATIIAEFKPEAECLRDLQHDSVRMIIISRGLTAAENQAYTDNLQYRPRFDKMADDAVAVVVNRTHADSVFTLQELKDLLLGASNKNLQVAVDGNSATSTVRYLIDSVLNGKPLGKNVSGAKNSEDLINYIAGTPGAVGFVGVSWLTNPQGAEQQQALAKVKMALIECKNCDKDEYARPSQHTIMFHQYPLVRGLHYVLKENFSGLGSGFINFLTLERGQLIFSRASLVPTHMQFNRRRTNLVE
jgi:phosphate transport system substrate-binding protein